MIFGFGWSLNGTYPGPLYAEIGTGYSVSIVGLLSTFLDNWTFARFQHVLPD
ncbi:MAG TPA: hypothetical protein VIS49_01305 [Cyclobacteriaceae bacterium]